MQKPNFKEGRGYCASCGEASALFSTPKYPEFKFCFDCRYYDKPPKPKQEKNPIRKLERLGDWTKNHGFAKADRKLLSSEIATNKIRKIWAKVEVPVDIYFLNTSKVRKFSEFGGVPEQFVIDLGLNIPFAKDAINILYTGNFGVEKVPMTGWIMAHRFGHAIEASQRMYKVYTKEKLDNLWEEFERKVYMILRGYASNVYHVKTSQNKFYEEYEKINLCLIANNLGTMKSAINKEIKRPHEFIYEIFAQFLVTGKIKFNKLGTLERQRKSFGNKTYLYVKNNEALEKLNNALENFAYALETMAEGIIDNAVGKIFLM